ncbi:MAG: GGDEF domain-containing protein [Coriobacteriia bacterium]|nr:GGDEF domain-containing protein [Coriobacteriia bacterium]
MESQINLMAIDIANALGVITCVMLFVGSSWRLRNNDREARALLAILTVTLISCVVDPVVFHCDGVPGAAPRAVVWLGNAWLYVANMLMACGWTVFLWLHLNGYVSKRRLRVLRCIIAAGLLVMVVNWFVPLAFSVDDQSVYTRGPFYWIYLAAGGCLYVDNMLMYGRARRRGGALKFFPVGMFFVPLICGVAIQTVVYGVSTIWPCNAISLAAVLSSLQNELIFRDKLTGLYNRFHLDTLKDAYARQKEGRVTVMMLDLNGFKRINDTLGHSVGDQALRDTAEILSQAVDVEGVVIRYAGDEFVIILNTVDDARVDAVRTRISDGFQAFNQVPGRAYELSISLGCSSLDLRTQSLDALMAEVDKRMYEDKREFYRSHAEMDRRRR